MDAPLSFVCNICDRANLLPAAALTREAPTCACGSSVRTRAIVHLLSLGLFGRSLALRDFPCDRGVRGLGLSDWEGYAGPLAQRLDYRNTFFHQAPRLDITAVPPESAGTADFLIAADVLQNVADPVQRAFDGAARLLRPGGLLVLTLPHVPGAATIEHFPGMGSVEMQEHGGVRELHATGVGRIGAEPDLVFHGGVGFTVEMRRFGTEDLLERCRRAGFDAVRVAGEAVPERGIAWSPWSQPVVARRAA